MKRKKVFLAMVFLLSIFRIFSGGVVFAQSDDTSTTVQESRKVEFEKMKQAVAANREAIKSKKQGLVTGVHELRTTIAKERLEQKEMGTQRRESQLSIRCASVNERISKVLSGNNVKQEKDVQRFESLSKRLAKLINTFSGKGYDVTELQNAVTLFDQKIVAIKTDFAAYVDILKSSKDLDCGSSEGAFKGKILEARAKLVDLNLALLDVRKHFETQVRPALEKLRQQHVSSKKIEKLETVSPEALVKPSISNTPSP
jgi:hypothetical protein